MSEQRGRERDPWKLPGEGTGVYGVDPLVYLKPGDNAEVDEILEELRTDCDEGDPFFVDYKKHKRKPRAAAGRGTGDGGGRDSISKRNGGMSPRWLGYATLAIVGPVLMLLLAVRMARRPAPDALREPAAREARREMVVSTPSPASAKTGVSGDISVSAAPPALSWAAPHAETAAPSSPAGPVSAPSDRAATGRPNRIATSREPFKKKMEPTPTATAPRRFLKEPESVPAEVGAAPETSVLTHAPVVEKPEAEF